MLPFTLLELTTQIKKLFPDKSSVPSGIRVTNRMQQAGDAEFQSPGCSYYLSVEWPLRHIGIPRATY